MVRVTGWLGVVLFNPTDAGLKEQVIPALVNESAQVRLTVPLKPLSVATVIVEVGELPGVVFTLVGSAVRV